MTRLAATFLKKPEKEKAVKQGKRGLAEKRF